MLLLLLLPVRPIEDFKCVKFHMALKPYIVEGDVTVSLVGGTGFRQYPSRSVFFSVDPFGIFLVI